MTPRIFDQVAIQYALNANPNAYSTTNLELSAPSGTKKNWLDLFPPLQPKKSLSFWIQMQEIAFFEIFKKILLWVGFPH